MSNITQIAAPRDEDGKYKQTYFSYGWEKCKKQPFVPLGALATCIALGGATVALRSGNRKQFNKYLRYRVAAQGVTVLAAVAGALLVTNKAEDIASSRERVAMNQLPPDKEPSSYASPIASGSGAGSNRLAKAGSSSSSRAPVPPAPSAQTSSPMASDEDPSAHEFESRSLPSALAPGPNTQDKSTVITALRKRAAEQKQRAVDGESGQKPRASLKNTGPTRQGGYEGDFGGKGFEARLREAEKNTEDDQISA